MNETRQFGATGIWNRQQELLKEARRLHLANQALRASKTNRDAQAEGGGKLAGRSSALSVDVPANGSTTPGARHRPGFGRTGNGKPAWRAAAGRVGTSLVSVGRRLEHVGWRDCE